MKAKEPPKSIAVMQPYFFPYLGYWQLIKSVDIFVIFDDVNFIKKGYINRNTVMGTNGLIPIVLPIKAASQNKKINELKYKFDEKLIKTIEQEYRKAENFSIIMPEIIRLTKGFEGSLSEFLEYQIKEITKILDINTEIVRSSEYEMGVMGKNKIEKLCKHFAVEIYKNSIGGLHLYSRENFDKIGVDLKFIQSDVSVFEYSGGAKLSIIDFLMRVPQKNWQSYLNSYMEI